MIDRREILAEAERLTLLPNVVVEGLRPRLDAGWRLRPSLTSAAAGCSRAAPVSRSAGSRPVASRGRCRFHATPTQRTLDDTFLKRVFGEVGQWIYDRTGIEMPGRQAGFRYLSESARHDLLRVQDQLLLGRSHRRSGGWPRVKLADLTADVAPRAAAGRAAVSGPQVLGCSQRAASRRAGLLVRRSLRGEDARALAERTRPRDLDDVIDLFPK